MKNWMYEEQDIINEEAECEEDKVSGFDFMDGIIDDILDENNDFPHLPTNYLHGDCIDFAFSLKNVFGYDVHILYPTDFFGSGGRYIVHAYCTFIKNNTTYYVDIRGITDDKDLFWKEFEGDIKSNGYDVQDKIFNTLEECNHFFEYDDKDDLDLQYEIASLEAAENIIVNPWINQYYNFEKVA